MIRRILRAAVDRIDRAATARINALVDSIGDVWDVPIGEDDITDHERDFHAHHVCTEQTCDREGAWPC